MFDAQYEETATVAFSNQVLDDIEVIFNQHDLSINDNEIRAITEYFIKS